MSRFGVVFAVLAVFGSSLYSTVAAASAEVNLYSARKEAFGNTGSGLSLCTNPFQ